MRSELSKSARFLKPSFVTQILTSASNPNIISFAGGLPNSNTFPSLELNKAANTVFSKFSPMALQYSNPQGIFNLRQFISERYQRKHNLYIPPEEIIITSGAQQAIDLIVRLFLNSQDYVLLEDPTYIGALDIINSLQSKIISLTLSKNGISPSLLKAVLKKNRKIKFFYCIPNFHNPAGISYSLQVRRDISKLAAENGLIIIEDDAYEELSFSNKTLPPIKKYLPDQTFLLGSFSKSIAPGIRLGWICAPQAYLEKLVLLKQSTDFHSNQLVQYIVSEYLSQNNYDEHIHQINTLYQNNAKAMQKAIKQYLPKNLRYFHPSGGMFIWLQLPPGTDTESLFQKAISKNLAFVPGSAFSTTKKFNRYIRLNFSNSDPNKIDKGISILGSVLKSH